MKADELLCNPHFERYERCAVNADVSDETRQSQARALTAHLLWLVDRRAVEQDAEKVASLTATIGWGLIVVNALLTRCGSLPSPTDHQS